MTRDAIAQALKTVRVPIWDPYGALSDDVIEAIIAALPPKTPANEERLATALRKLVFEVNACLGISEPEMREALGHTNVNVLRLRRDEAVAVLQAETPSPTSAICATCRHFRGVVEDGETSEYYGRCCHPSEAHPLHWQDVTADFGCTLYAPGPLAPQEERMTKANVRQFFQPEHVNAIIENLVALYEVGEASYGPGFVTVRAEMAATWPIGQLLTIEHAGETSIAKVTDKHLQPDGLVKVLFLVAPQEEPG